MKEHMFENVNYFLHGADYNPDQWLDYPEILKKDMEFMKEANMNEMSLGIFSWDTLEPEEGVYDFSFLDDAIERIGQNGGKVLLATPSGARPRWLAEKYPEITRVNQNLQKEHYGGRHNHCYSSKIYKEKVKNINSLLANRYANNPTVIGWHISNEYGGYCYCPECQKAFRNWLKEKYHNNIKELNDAYWSSFWSHKYQNFEQINAPSNVDDSCLLGLNLDWKRFSSLQARQFMIDEIKAVRAANPKLPVTTNFMWDFYDYDYQSWSEVLDFVSWDAYPTWHDGNNADVANETAFWHDLFRSLKSKPFVLMESAPGLVNWQPVCKLKPEGMDVLASIQAVAHGADSVQYFQFRKGRGSIEKFHGAVVDHVGTNDTRIFKNVCKTGSILKHIGEIAGTSTDAKVAIIYSWENRWALDASCFASKDKTCIDTCYKLHNQFFKRGIDCDIISPHADLSKYSLVIAPTLYLVDKQAEDNFRNYVKNGGNLYATYFLGMVNETDLVHLGGFPCNSLKEVFGIWNEELDSLYENEKVEICMDNQKFSSSKYAEIIHSKTATTIATFGGTFYEGFPAITSNKFGKGNAYYQAFYATDEILDSVFDRLLKKIDLKNTLDSNSILPEGLTISTRKDENTEYVIVQNYNSEQVVNFKLKNEYIDILTNNKVSQISIDKYSFAILKNI